MEQQLKVTVQTGSTIKSKTKSLRKKHASKEQFLAKQSLAALYLS
jgi:hypothetical protein